MLPAWRPVPSFGSTMIIFGIFGVIFLTLGITLYVMSERIQGVVQQYDKECQSKLDVSGNEICTISIEIDSDIQAPIYVYYQLDNFYQNHRRYVKSRSNEQLMGNELSVDELEDCDPIKKNKDLGDNITYAADGITLLLPDEPAFPCGLVAKSFFTDEFVLKDPAGGLVTISSDNIAWESDKEYKFKNGPNW